MKTPHNPEAMENALIDLGLDVISVDKHLIKFWYKGNTIQYFFKKQWASGKGITDCRGWDNMIKQLK